MQFGSAIVFLALAGVAALLACASAALPQEVRAEPSNAGPRDILTCISSRSVLASSVFVLTLAVLSGVLEILMPLELRAVETSALATGAFFLGASLLAALAGPFVGRWSDRRGRLEPICWGLAPTIQ